MRKSRLLPLIIAATLSTTLTNCSDSDGENSSNDNDNFQTLVQAHRGGAALYPENTIPAMLNAVRLDIPTLELDLYVTADSQVVVTHEPFMNSTMALQPDGSPIPAGLDSTFAVYRMTYDSLALYDVGSLHNPSYPRRVDMKCHVPRVVDLIDSVEAYATSLGRAPRIYNIEIKSWPEHDGIYTPAYDVFTDICMKALLSRNLGNRLVVQCFDLRTLDYLHKNYPGVRISYLVDYTKETFEEIMAHIDFTPEFISPDQNIVDSMFVDKAHKLGMKVVPWTVDRKEDALRLSKLRVDEIITNQPDSATIWLSR